jgi:hypothetical protein
MASLYSLDIVFKLRSIATVPGYAEANPGLRKRLLETYNALP